MTVTSPYDWLQKEIDEIKTPKFHLIDGQAEPAFRDAVSNSALDIPRSYMDFVIRFGNAKLYRRDRDGYGVVIWAGPRSRPSPPEAPFYFVGFHGGGYIGVRRRPSGIGHSVVENDCGTETDTELHFDEWLYHACTAVREQIDDSEWRSILLGPPPFSAMERAIVAARRQMLWERAGVDVRGRYDLQSEKRDPLTLPFLTIGARSRDKHLNGGLFLKTGHIPPGQSGEVHASAYKEFVDPAQMEFFSLPDPQPEDRKFYWELSHG